MSDNKIKNELLETKDIIRKMDELSENELAVCSDNICAKDDCLLVPFCCATTLPRGFDLQVSGGHKNLIYDVSCLKCCLEKCKIEVTTNCCGNVITDYVDAFAVKIVGCIRYIASASPVKNDSRYPSLCGGDFIGTSSGYDEFDNSGEGFICCQGCVCVDKVIGCMIPDSPTCNCDCPEISCQTVKVKKYKVTEEKSCPNCKLIGKLDDQRIIKFSGCFEIPSCNNGNGMGCGERDNQPSN